MQRITPVILSEVVLLAKSSSALHLAQGDPERIKQWLCSPWKILRHRSTYKFDGAPPRSGNGTTVRSQQMSNPYEYDIAMTQPVLQGVADASRTSFVVTTLNSPPFDPSVSRSVSANLADSLANSPIITPSEHPSDLSDADGIEIGEGFLANSVPPLSASVSGLNGLNGNTSPLRWRGESSDSLLGSDGVPLTNGAGTSYDSESDVGSSAAIFLQAQSLETTLSQRNLMDKGEDSEAFAYVSSSDLGRLGLFSGDWV